MPHQIEPSAGAQRPTKPDTHHLRRTGLLWELVGVALFLPCLGVWVAWISSYPRLEALQRAPAWEPDATCPVLSVIPWRRSHHYARCWPLGLPSEHPVAFAGLHLLMAGSIAMAVVGGNRRRAANRVT